jgi:heme/copper-type cytochrome/quinol oxidase subunit 4
MSIDTHTLIWLFPIAFMFHDFEEIILFEPWLRKNAGEIEVRIKNRVPAFLVKQIGAILDKSATEFAFPVSLIFGLTFISSFLAVEYEEYGFFLLASGAFFLHGFMHLGQAIALRRYVPAIISSVLIVIPYGLVLYWRLIKEGMVDMSGLLIYFLLAVALTIPFILVMHKVGDYLYKKTVRLLID